MKTQSKIEEAQTVYEKFISGFQSMNLATVDEAGNPNASYAPFAHDENNNLYVFISGLSKHTSNMFHTKKASVLFVEDESKADHIFARKRLTYSCETTLIEREDSGFEAGAKLLEAKFGASFAHMMKMPDFRLFKISPTSGLFVIGFGAAFAVAEDLKQLTHLGGEGGKAHSVAHKL